MERQEVGLLLGLVTPLASTQLAKSLQGRDMDSILQRGNRLREVDRHLFALYIVSQFLHLRSPFLDQVGVQRKG